MTDGPRPGATETFARTRTECSERLLPEPSSSAVQQRSLSRRGRTALAIAGVALASLLMAASVGCGTKVEAPASPSPSATTPTETSPSPSPSASVIDTEPTETSLEISASLINNPEALMHTFINDRVTEWFNAGATPENAQAALDSNTETIDEFAARVAAQYDKEFIDALLIKDWESNPGIVAWVDNMILIHKTTVALYFYTSFPDINPDDKQPYERRSRSIKNISVENQTDNTVTIVDRGQNYDNADLNRVGEDLTGGEKLDGEIGDTMRSFVVVNGEIKLSDLSYLGRTN